MNNEGLRGAKAVQGMQKGQIAIQLPVHLTVPLGDGLVTPEVYYGAWSPCMAPQSLPDLQCFDAPREHCQLLTLVTLTILVRIVI